MATDPQNEYLVTGDTDGNISVWNISNYALIDSATEDTLVRVKPRMTFLMHIYYIRLSFPWEKLIFQYIQRVEIL